MNFLHLLHEIRVELSISSIVSGRWLQYGQPTSFGRPLTTISSTSCHAISASSSTQRVLSFRPLRIEESRNEAPAGQRAARVFTAPTADGSGRSKRPGRPAALA